MSFQNLEDCSWFPFSDEPIVKNISYASRICKPFVLFPEESVDGKWHLFFHSWLGIHHWKSDSGISWEKDKLVEVRGTSPFIFREKENYYLIYEKHNRNLPFGNFVRADGHNTGSSRIEMRVSTDLENWSKPRLLIESIDIPFAEDYLKRPRVSNPCMIKTYDGYRLYFGASHIVLPDTKQRISRYLGYAVSKDINGPFVLANDSKPLMEPAPDDSWINIGCGQVGIIDASDRIYATECGVSWDENLKKTVSRLFILVSDDGLNFRRLSQKPVLVPAGKGWASSYITGCCLKYRKSEECWYCYFSANSYVSGKIVKEQIGLMLASLPYTGEVKEKESLQVFFS